MSEEFEKFVEDLLALTGEPNEHKLCLRIGLSPMRLHRWRKGTQVQEAFAYIAKIIEEYKIKPGKVESAMRRRLLKEPKP